MARARPALRTEGEAHGPARRSGRVSRRGSGQPAPPSCRSRLGSADCAACPSRRSHTPAAPSAPRTESESAPVPLTHRVPFPHDVRERGNGGGYGARVAEVHGGVQAEGGAALPREGRRLRDTVNLLFTICANESAPIALTYFHRFRQRFSTVFGYSVPLLSRGRSFSR